MYYFINQWQNDGDTIDECWEGLSLYAVKTKPRYHYIIKSKKSFIKHYSYIYLYPFGQIHIPFKTLRKIWTKVQQTGLVEFISFNSFTKQLQIYGEEVKNYE